MIKARVRGLGVFLSIAMLGSTLAACRPVASSSTRQTGAEAKITVLAAESFIADMAQNVAGDRLQVETLMPLGLDPHAFEPTPQDVARIADSEVLIVNGSGFEDWLEEVLANAGGERKVIEAAAGLASRSAREGEEAMASDSEQGDDSHHEAGDPHFWLDPIQAIAYVENIRDGLNQVDPTGKDVYTRNAATYIEKLRELDAFISQQVARIPAERRQIVTNHESFGYFADRYGFTIVGTVVPSISTGAAPSARQLVQLVDRIKATGVPAIFLETGANPQLAQQVAEETGVVVVADLISHSVTPPDGPAPTYVDMMRHNTQAIVGALTARDQP